MEYFVAENPVLDFLYDSPLPPADEALPGAQVTKAFEKLKDYFQFDPTMDHYVFADIGWPRLFIADDAEKAAGKAKEDVIACLRVGALGPIKSKNVDVYCPKGCICRPQGNLHQTTCYVLNEDGTKLALALTIGKYKINAYVVARFDLVELRNSVALTSSASNADSPQSLEK